MTFEPDPDFIARQAEACRRLWVEVILNAVRSVSIIEHRGSGAYATQHRVCTKEQLRDWLYSADGAEVMEHAGYEPTDELRETILSAARDPGEGQRCDRPANLSGRRGPKRGFKTVTRIGHVETIEDEAAPRPVSLPYTPWNQSPPVPLE